MASRSLPTLLFSILGAAPSTATLSQVVVLPGEQTVPPRASEAEIKVIRDYFGFDSMNSNDLEKILSIDAYRWPNSESEPYDLAAYVWLKPIFAQGAVCIVREVVALGRPSDEGYRWEDEEQYHHWLGESESECAVESPDQFPRSVATRERIATDVMIQILEAEEELLERTLDQSDPEDIGGLARDWRIERITINRLDSELGFAYHATFSAPDRVGGPSCTFTMADGEIQIHFVSYWVA